MAGKKPLEKPSIPFLGANKKDIYAAWEKADAFPREVIVGHDIFSGGVYDWYGGKINRVEKIRSKQGMVATRRLATQAELEEIDIAIERGAFQIEGREISGAFGVRDLQGGELTRVLHRATGRQIGQVQQ